MALRIGIGYHFLYEGVWKIVHRKEFTAEPFLSQAKGPVSALFYGMLPDIYGKERLKLVLVERTNKDGKKEQVFRSESLTDRWAKMQESFVAFYQPQPETDAKPGESLDERSKKVLDVFQRDVEDYFTEIESDTKAYFGSLDRFQADKDAGIDAPFQQKRRWDKMMDLRKEAAGWIKEIETRELAMQKRFSSLLSDQQKAKGAIPASWNPLSWPRIEQVNFGVTFALTAIGFCLVLGLFTRPAALGGAAFMLSVVLTQPAWPGIYPPDPPVVGHALLVNKDFIEMIGLVLLATTAVGRWGGLDFFLYNLIVEPFLSKRMRTSDSVKRNSARQNA